MTTGYGEKKPCDHKYGVHLYALLFRDVTLRTQDRLVRKPRQSISTDRMKKPTVEVPADSPVEVSANSDNKLPAI